MKTVFAFLISYICFSASQAQTTYLDSTFGVDGKTQTYIKGYQRYTNVKTSMALQADGKILVAADSNLLRYNSDGSLDTSFNYTGKVFMSHTIANAVAVQSDQKILVAGNGDSVNNTFFVCLRFNPNGSIDTSFNGGKTKTYFIGFKNVFCNSIGIQDNGRILLGGDIYYSYALARYLPNGKIDTSFGIMGQDTISYDPISYGNFYVTRKPKILLQKDKKIVMVGGGELWNDPQYFIWQIFLVRFDSSGNRDVNFNSNARKNGTERYCKFYSAVMQNDDRLILTGTNENDAGHFLYRNDTDGTLDTSYAKKSFTAPKGFNLDDRDLSSDLIIQRDGKILTAMSHNTTKTLKEDFTLLRLTPNGELDSTFDSTGIISTDFNNDDDYLSSMIAQKDNKIILAGHTDSAISLARYFNVGITSGTINFSQQKQNPLTFPNPIHDEAMLQYTLEKEERISINAYDINGRIAKTILSNQAQSAGIQKQQMNLADLKSGTYIICISNGDGNMEVKIVKE